MIEPAETKRERARGLGIALLVCLAFGALTLVLGKDTNLDLLNYHYYNAYAFLEGRMGFDIMPAHTSSFINPTIDIPFFLLSQRLPGGLIAFLLGVLHGLNTVLIFRLAKCVLEPAAGNVLPWLVAFAGTLGAGSLALIGTTFYDNIYSIPVLLGLNLVFVRLRCATPEEPMALIGPRIAFAAGLCVGIAVGLKLPAAIYAVGLCGALLFSATPGKSVPRAFLCGLGVLAGMFLLSGHWLWTMWSVTGNPFFPWLNNIFPSPLADIASNRELARLPKSALETAFYPVFFTLKPWILNLPFRDPKILAAFVAVPATVLFVAAGHLTRRFGPNLPPAVRILLAFVVLSYLAWIVIFGTYRYAIVIEMLSPLCVVICLAMLFRRDPRRRRLAFVAAAGLLIAVQPGDWGRRSWQNDWFNPFVSVAIPDALDFESAMVLVPGWYPASDWRPSGYLIPAFPPDVPFLRISSMPDPALEVIKGFDPEIRRRIREHRGPLYVLYNRENTHAVPRSLRRYAKRMDTKYCHRISSNMSLPFEICRAVDLN